MEYQLDTNAARQADVLHSRIEEKGQYLGVITRAEPVTSKKGSKGVDFSFKANSGATADYLTIWTNGADGKQLQGYNLLMAIMTCLRVKGLSAELGEVEKYDRDLKKRIKTQTPIFKELMNKPIGLLIHMEQYEKTDGGTAWKPAISAPFDANGFTASESLSQAKEATTLDKMVAALRDRPLKDGHATAPQSSMQQTGGSFDDLASDTPFAPLNKRGVLSHIM